MPIAAISPLWDRAISSIEHQHADRRGFSQKIVPDKKSGTFWQDITINTHKFAFNTTGVLKTGLLHRHHDLRGVTQEYLPVNLEKVKVLDADKILISKRCDSETYDVRFIQELRDRDRTVEVKKYSIALRSLEVTKVDEQINPRTRRLETHIFYESHTNLLLMTPQSSTDPRLSANQNSYYSHSEQSKSPHSNNEPGLRRRTTGFESQPRAWNQSSSKAPQRSSTMPVPGFENDYFADDVIPPAHLFESSGSTGMSGVRERQRTPYTGTNPESSQTAESRSNPLFEREPAPYRSSTSQPSKPAPVNTEHSAEIQDIIDKYRMHNLNKSIEHLETRVIAEKAQLESRSTVKYKAAEKFRKQMIPIQKEVDALEDSVITLRFKLMNLDPGRRGSRQRYDELSRLKNSKQDQLDVKKGEVESLQKKVDSFCSSDSLKSLEKDLALLRSEQRRLSIFNAGE